MHKSIKWFFESVLTLDNLMVLNFAMTTISVCFSDGVEQAVYSVAMFICLSIVWAVFEIKGSK